MIPIKLNTGGSWQATQADLELWYAAYPAVNVDQELSAMAVWCDANPTRRKTQRGIKQFVANWLNRAQNQGGSPMAKKAGAYGGMRSMSTDDNRTDISWLDPADKQRMRGYYMETVGQVWDGQTIERQEKKI